jgi:YgiT-type zinc finger domain-containing protein
MSVCVICGANRVERKMVSQRRRDGTRVSVPAFVCGACGERTFDLAVLEGLDRNEA